MEIQIGKRRKIPLLKIGNIQVMMDIYAKMEMIINRVLHFHHRKIGSLFSQKEIVELPYGGKFLCWKIGYILGSD